MSERKISPLAAALLGAGMAVVGSAGAFNLNPGDWFKPKQEAQQPAQRVAAAVPSPVVPVAPSNANGIAPVAAPNFRAIVQQYGPAVVGVTVEGTHRTAAQELPPGFEEDPFFQFFRGIPGFGNPGRRGGGQVPFRGQGSGFIVSADGLILTNAHVVREAKEVTVKLQDRREYRAKVLGADPATDVAVLRIEAKNLPVVRLGDLKNIEVGDPVLAIGAPFGLEQTATQGIVSAKGRSLPGDAYVPFIQTDAAVNPGNSGGPLFDGAGNVIGINAQIYSQTGGYMGLSFAIPIDVALKVKDQIVTQGKAQHARLGVQIQDLNQTLAESFGLVRPDGALVAGVAPDSAAAKAGLKSGDVITEVNGEPIVRSGQLSSRIGLASPGDKVKLKVWRDKSTREIDVKLGSADESSTRNAAADDDNDGTRLGLALRPLSKAELSRAKVDHGLVIEDVGGPAARAGVQPGDLLLAVNGKPVSSVQEVQALMKDKPKNVALLIERDGERIFVPVRLG
ncbi:MAG TPA: DegQ family serine endoprotease [Burkholderiaceae bacterium]|nr:DegQ family serine endoprotease [Burkholderiaceae bacterium]